MDVFSDFLVEERVSKRRAAIGKARRHLEALASSLAGEYDNYEDFRDRLTKLMPQAKPEGMFNVVIDHETGKIGLDLQRLWVKYNDEQQKKLKIWWDELGKQRPPRYRDL